MHALHLLLWIKLIEKSTEAFQALTELLSTLMLIQ